jgi:hypothetical protein
VEICFTILSQSNIIIVNEFEKDLEGSGRGLSRHYRSISLDGLNRTTEAFSEDSQYPGQNIEPNTSRMYEKTVAA